MSGQGAHVERDQASAQEILRQAQAVILAQGDALKGLETKSLGLLQATLSLATGSLGGVVVLLGVQQGGAAEGLPPWAGLGLGVAGLIFAFAAFRAAWALRPTSFAIGAIRPGELLNSGYDTQPADKVYLAIAYELDRAISSNDRLGRLAASRFETALHTALLPPVCGAAMASILALSGQWRVTIGFAVVAFAFLFMGRLTAWLAEERVRDWPAQSKT
ncbi:hypothetical protein [Falsiroseomonas sp. E2-1-a20]|uniref:hypothetical protein n=1 Tax=Falsiroseomonas sp. E2-1-a20 TaxID=3239300 RepID=UPI003F3AD6AF